MVRTLSPTNLYLPDLVGGGYGEFWRCRSRYRVLKGGKGSKKSTTAALNFIVRLMQNPDANLLVVRKVGDTHRTSTFAQLRWAIRRLGVEGCWKATTSPMELTYLPTGQKILFRGLDDPLKLASTTAERGFCAGSGSRRLMKLRARRISTSSTSRPRAEPCRPPFSSRPP